MTIEPVEFDVRVTFTYGLPASGKTTLANALCESAYNDYRRVSLDDIRAMFRGPWSPALEDAAQAVVIDAVEHLLVMGFDVVVDNTHVSPRLPRHIRQRVNGLVTDGLFDSVDWDVIDCTDVDVDTCIARDATREHAVGEKAIRHLASQLEKHGHYLTKEWLEGDRPD